MGSGLSHSAGHVTTRLITDNFVRTEVHLLYVGLPSYFSKGLTNYGEGGGLQNERGGGEQVKVYPYEKKGGGRKKF